ncbi:MAG TPA: hypothetical protein VGN97_23485 [Mesorhizobium sp.]|jgi:hypothetical protein|nr:hypothetical protein [Mesorhizobium sp.]
MRRALPALCALALAAPALAAGQTEGVVLLCRVEVVFACGQACEDFAQPAELSLNFGARTGSFCRGTMCTEAGLSSLALKGRLDDRDYLAFRLGGPAEPFEVTGALNPDRRSFAAVSDEIGHLAGQCEPGEGE